mmetsp:Transcript_11098/g.16091  ORF Transcript_11098/g.16091 Transcript_11098/m.16091 type:complete len:208 (+) Transcript_11098:955-1578(+)
MVLYWKLRVCDLGMEKAFLTYTIQNCFTKEQIQPLNFGFLRLVPVTDLYGRSIIFVEVGRIHGKAYDANIMKRSIFYMCHAALDRPNVEKNGVIFIFYMKTAIQKYSKPEIAYHLLNTMNCFPFRIKAIHFCCFCNFIQKRINVPAAQYMLRPYLRHRVISHKEEGAELLERLQQFGLPPESLPTELGGEIKLDHEKWVHERIVNGL